MELKLVQCTPMYERYLKAFDNTMSNRQLLINDTPKFIKQAVLYGVKYIINHRYEHKDYITKEEVEAKFCIVEMVRSLMMKLTPKDFVNLFPIKKEYDGEKYCWKDYFYTTNKLKDYDMDAPLNDRLEDFIWDYTNDTICEFMAEMLSTASKLRQFEGQPSIMEEWAEKNNIPTYTLNEKDGYILDNQTHKSVPYKKPVPNYMKLVN